MESPAKYPQEVKILGSYFKRIPHFSLLRRLCRKSEVKVWLVGGFLRDAVLRKNKEFTDFDFCLEGDAEKFAQSFAALVGSKVITLDDGMGSFRVVVSHAGRNISFDFSRLRARDLPEDLRSRDFSINTLVLPLFERRPAVYDYCGAVKDIQRGVLRLMGKRVLADDPLRILRGFYFFAAYGFSLSRPVLRLMAAHKRLLSRVSKERISEELYKIFACQDSYKAVKPMADAGVLEVILPELSSTKKVGQGAYHHLDVFDHSLETLRMFERLRERELKSQVCRQYLAARLAGFRTRAQLIKLACLLHDIGKPAAKKRKGKKTIFHMHEKIGAAMAAQISRRLRLSGPEKNMLGRLIFWHLRPGYLADQKKPTRRAVYRFFRDTGFDGVAVIMLSLSDWRATRGPLTDFKKRRTHERVMLGLIKEYFAAQKRRPLPALLNGYVVMEKFNLTPSPLVGKILRRVREEQALGRVRTFEQALCLAKKIMDGKRHEQT